MYVYIRTSFVVIEHVMIRATLIRAPSGIGKAPTFGALM